MRFRCRHCDVRADNTAAISAHVVEEHGRPGFGWSIVRIPERPIERPVTWLSNLPVRIRARYGSRSR
ncbi:hypothetical protein [Halobellus sp. GM3]|uniref:hypothetical protein n=1 Tax=Halobellus sp. GM3 TaxID=3458410 RepID=UPI00403DA41B